MKINRQGCTRIVFVFADVVVKVPNFLYCWHHFLQGLVANINENKTWKYNGFDDERRALRDQLLCPVLWCSWGGWILIMKRAEVCKFLDEEGQEIDYSKWVVVGWGGDDKPDNYGTLNGRIVKLDYA